MSYGGGKGRRTHNDTLSRITAIVEQEVNYGFSFSPPIGQSWVLFRAIILGVKWSNLRLSSLEPTVDMDVVKAQLFEQIHYRDGHGRCFCRRAQQYGGE